MDILVNKTWLFHDLWNTHVFHFLPSIYKFTGKNVCYEEGSITVRCMLGFKGISNVFQYQVAFISGNFSTNVSLFCNISNGFYFKHFLTEQLFTEQKIVRELK